MRVHCHTNLDNYKNTQWPNEMQTIPLKGDRVRARSGVKLKVVGITHGEIVEPVGNSLMQRNFKPCVFIELNK